MIIIAKTEKENKHFAFIKMVEQLNFQKETVQSLKKIIKNIDLKRKRNAFKKL